MRWKIGLLIILLACSAAQAEVYQWTDVKGVVHFTDNLDKVPFKYRNQLTKMGPSNLGEGEKPSDRQMPSVEASPPVAASPPVEQKREVYGGHDERWWRTRFASAGREVMTARERLAAKKDSLRELRHKRVVYHKPSDRVAYNALSEEISRDEEKLKALEESIAKLESEAGNLGVPADWRR